MKETSLAHEDENKHMTQRIENSDRGITLNKSLAWTMAVGLITGSLWLGSSMGDISRRMDQFAEVSSIGFSERAELEIRVRALENSMAQSRVQFEAIYGAIQDLKTDQREITNLLRQIVNERVTP